MTIRNLDFYIEGIWDWAILDGCFGATKIKPADLDGIVERNGQFLVFECKRPGKSIPYGQRCTLEAMRKNGSFTVIIVWGEQGEPRQIQTMTTKGDTIYNPADAELLRSLVRAWFAWANKKRRPNEFSREAGRERAGHRRKRQPTLDNDVTL